MLLQDTLIDRKVSPAASYTREAITAAPLYAARRDTDGQWLHLAAASEIWTGGRVSGLSEGLRAG